jgi:hypothetical protein
MLFDIFVSKGPKSQHAQAVKHDEQARAHIRHHGHPKGSQPGIASIRKAAFMPRAKKIFSFIFRTVYLLSRLTYGSLLSPASLDREHMFHSIIYSARKITSIFSSCIKLTKNERALLSIGDEVDLYASGSSKNISEQSFT